MKDEQFSLKDDEELIEESNSYKVRNNFKVTGESGTYIDGVFVVGQGIIKTASTVGQTAVEGVSTASSIAAKNRIKSNGSWILCH